MNRLQLNLALVVIVGALAATLYLTREQPEKGPPLTPLTDATLERIRIEHPGAPAIVLQKQDGAWQLTAPVHAAADAMEVASIVSLAGAEAQRKLSVAEVELKELKLDPPQYTLTLNDTRLDFGDSEPIDFRRYVRVGDDVALIAEPSAAALDADYSDLVAKELLPAGAEIQSLALPDLTVARSTDGQSWVLMPDQADVGADQKQQLVDAWRSARAMWNAAAEGGPGEPVTILLKDGRVFELVVVARTPQLIIENPALKVRHTLSKALEGELLQLPAPAPAAGAALPGQLPLPVGDAPDAESDADAPAP